MRQGRIYLPRNDTEAIIADRIESSDTVVVSIESKGMAVSTESKKRPLEASNGEKLKSNGAVPVKKGFVDLNFGLDSDEESEG